MGFLEIMNSNIMYILVVVALLYVFGMCIVIMRQAWERALELGISKEKLMQVVKSSALFTIVPSLSIVIGLFSLQAVLGVPWSWFRLSVIGLVSYELIAVDMATVGAGLDSLSSLISANDPITVGAVMLAMSLGIIGVVVDCLFT